MSEYNSTTPSSRAARRSATSGRFLSTGYLGLRSFGKDVLHEPNQSSHQIEATGKHL